VNERASFPNTLVILGACGSSRETYCTVKAEWPGTRVVFAADYAPVDEFSFPDETLPIIKDWDFDAVRERLGEGDANAFRQFICGMGSPRTKKALVERALSAGLTPAPSVISSKAHVCPDVVIGRGGIIKPLSTVQTGARLGDYVSVFIGILGHDGVVGDYATIGANSVAAGCVTLGEGVCLGLGATVRQHVTIAPWVEAGMGAIVVKDVTEPGITLVGNPARKLNGAPGA